MFSSAWSVEADVAPADADFAAKQGIIQAQEVRVQPREVVESAFRFEKTGTLPYWIPMEADVARRLDEHYGSPAWRATTDVFIRVVPYMFGRHVGAPSEAIGDGRRVDAFGSVIGEGSILRMSSSAISSALR